MDVYSPIVSGSGVAVLHRQIAERLPGYRVATLDPRLSLFPPALRWLVPAPAAAVTHSQPDLGPWVVHPDSALVATFHGYYLDAAFRSQARPAQKIFYATLLRHAIRRSLQRARYVTVVSHFLADLVQREWNLGARLVTIRNGVDAQHFQPAVVKQHEGVRILFTGNPTRNKGFSHLVALAESLPPTVSLRYTSPMRAGVNAVATSTLEALPSRPHAQMPALYQDSDIFFFPTVREGFGLAVAEAMACGLPVVATRCSALPELVDHGRGGFLFEPGNRREMHDYLQRLATDATLRRDMGAYNREKVLREFRVERMVDDYRDVFAAAAG